MFVDIPISFQKRAKYCAMGDLNSMLWMFHEFRNRLTDAYRLLESDYVRDSGDENLTRLKTYLQGHEEDRFSLEAAHMWLNRSALYGSKRAEALLKEYPFYRMFSCFGILFQLPGKQMRRSCSGTVMRGMGFLDFKENLSYDLESLNNNGVYIASCDASYDGPDETGFGMEEEYDYYFFDEFFTLLHCLRGWSQRDLRNNRGRIESIWEEKKTRKQRERNAFWRRAGIGMERYASLVCEINGPRISKGTLVTYQQNLKLPEGDFEHVTVPEGVTEIAPAAFRNCEKIGSVELPVSVTEIGEYAFSGCTNLKSFFWPARVTSVSKRVFFHCHGLEEVILPDTVTEIEEGAFLGCRSLKKIVLPDSVKKIGKDAFRYCESLDKIT